MRATLEILQDESLTTNSHHRPCVASKALWGGGDRTERL